MEDDLAMSDQYSYLDIKTSSDPFTLYTLDAKNGYNISAVYDINDRSAIKLVIHNQNGDPVDPDGEVVSTDSPYVANVVFSTASDHIRLIKNEMLKLADTLQSNIRENLSKGVSAMDKWEALKNTDPFDRGWSTNPQDAIDALEELGFTDIYTYDDGTMIHFSDEDDEEGEISVTRINQNTFQYEIHTTLDDDDQEYVDDSDDLYESSIGDQVRTVGVYGDYTGDYESLDSLVQALKNAGLQVTDLEGNEEYGWEFNVTGKAKTLYKMIDDKLPGYSCDSVQEFIDEYAIDEVEECDSSNLIKESTGKKYYVLMGYNSYPEAGIEGDDVTPIMVLGADNEAEAEDKCNYIRQHPDQYPEASTYEDLFVEEVNEDYIEEYFGPDYLEESNHTETLDESNALDTLLSLNEIDGYRVEYYLRQLGYTPENTPTLYGIPEDVAQKVIDKIRDEYQRDYDKYGDDCEVPYEAFDLLNLRVDESLEDDPDDVDQEYSSADTSINSSKLPSLFSKVKFNPGTVNLDWGGGKFDNVTEYLSKQDVTNLVYDKYNRSSQHNSDVLQAVRQNGGADTVTCSNVLNVIKEPEARLAVIQNCKKYLKNGGKAYFTVYYDTKKSEGPTKSGYQLHRKTQDYVSEIEQVFSNVTRKGDLIIAECTDHINEAFFDDGCDDCVDIPEDTYSYERPEIEQGNLTEVTQNEDGLYVYAFEGEITGTTYYTEEDYEQELSSRSMTEYEEDIVEAMEAYDEGEDNLAKYFDEDNGDYKLESIELSVVVREGKLYSHATCLTHEELDAEQIMKLGDWLLGQYSDGWGEGFEQQPIREWKEPYEIEYEDEETGEMYTEEEYQTVYTVAHFWNPNMGSLTPMI